MSRLLFTLVVVGFLLGSRFLFADTTESFVADRVVNSLNELPPELRDAIQRTWLFEDRHLQWSSYEQSKMKWGTKPPARCRVGHLKGRPSQKIIEVTYLYDKGAGDAEKQIGRLYLHQDVVDVPSDSTEEARDENGVDRLKRLTLNGVAFHISHPKGEVRDVYLEPGLKGRELRDRLRLAVNGNSILNPWIRREVEALWKSFGDPEEMPLSEEQQNALRAIIQDYRDGKLSLGKIIQLLTGMGKTELIIEFYRYLLKESKKPGAPPPPRIVWLVKDLPNVEQAQRRFQKRLGPDFRSVSWSSDTMSAQLQRTIAEGKVDHLFVSIDSLRSEGSLQLLESFTRMNERDLLIVADESHGLGAPTRREAFERIFERLKSRIMGRIGLSATPYHYDEGAIATLFPGGTPYYTLLRSSEIDPIRMISRLPYFSQLLRAMRAGYVKILLPYAGDYDQDFGSSDDNLYTPSELKRVLKDLEQFKPFKGMVFHAPGKDDGQRPVARARQFSEEAQKGNKFSGPVVHISGEMPPDEIDRRISAFAISTEGLLSAVNLGAQGLDIPDMNLMVLLRQSKSPNLLMQMIGRGLRLSSGGPFLRVYDPTRENLKILLKDLSHYFAANPAQRQKLQEIIAEGDRVKWSPEIEKRLYEVFPIAPRMLSPFGSFDLILDTIRHEIMEQRSFDINFDVAEKLGLSGLRSPEDGESLFVYLQTLEAQLDALNLLKPFAEVREQIYPLFAFRWGEVSQKELGHIWNRAFKNAFAEKQRKRAKIWPMSAEMKSELPRAQLIHQMVIRQYFERLSQDENAHVFFISRDADDFFHSMLAYIDQNAVDPDLNKKYRDRVHRLTVNHSLLQTKDASSLNLSGISDEELTKLLDVQGLTPALLASASRVYLFDVGYRGSLVRPILGNLLGRSPLTAKQFASKLRPELLISSQAGPKRPNGSKGLEGLERDELATQQQVLNSSENFQKEMSGIPSSPTTMIQKQRRATRINQWFSVNGAFMIPEFSWVSGIEGLIKDGRVSRAEAEKILGNLTLSHQRRENWVRHYLSGENASFEVREDLSRTEALAVKAKVDANGNFSLTRHESADPNAIPVNPVIAATRRNSLCQKVVESAQPAAANQ